MRLIRQVVKEKVFFFDQISRDLLILKAQDPARSVLANDTQISIDRIIFNWKFIEKQTKTNIE